MLRWSNVDFPFLALGPMLVLLGLMTSCGVQVNQSESKQFVLALQSGDTSLKPLLKRMIADYNNQLGYQALSYADTMDTANSPVLITKGLQSTDGKVGWGQWFTNTTSSGSALAMPGSKTNQVTTYSMQVEFDQDFLTRNNVDDANGQLNTEIRKLFAHEVGHGFQMVHDPNQNSVMYYDITGTKDFTAYWPRVKSFFGVN